MQQTYGKKDHSLNTGVLHQVRPVLKNVEHYYIVNKKGEHILKRLDKDCYFYCVRKLQIPVLTVISCISPAMSYTASIYI